MIGQYEKGKSATALYYPTQGVASAATVQLVDSSGTDVVAAATATIDTVSTTFTGAVKGDYEITVASATGIVADGRYWVATSGGRGHEATVADVVGTTVTLSEPLRFDIATGTFKGFSLSYALTTTHTASTERNCRLIWRYTVGGVARMHTEIVDIVPLPFAVPVTEHDIEAVDPAFGSLSSDYMALRERAEEDVFDWLAARQIYPDRVIDRRRLKAAVVYRVLELRYVRMRDPDQSERYHAMFLESLSNFQQSNGWYDHDDELDKDASVVSADGTAESGGDGRRVMQYVPVG